MIVRGYREEPSKTSATNLSTLAREITGDNYRRQNPTKSFNNKIPNSQAMTTTELPVFVAIPLENPNDFNATKRNSFDAGKCPNSLRQEQDISYPASTTPSLQQQDRRRVMLRHSFLAGLVIGLFIQCGMLGVYSNYVAMEYRSRTDARIFAWSWSVLASAVGCMLLLTLRALALITIRLAQGREGRGTRRQQEQTRGFMMKSLIAAAANGALTGVGVACIVTDCLLFGLFRETISSFLVILSVLGGLVVAGGWILIVSSCFRVNESDNVSISVRANNDLSQPLLIPSGDSIHADVNSMGETGNDDNAASDFSLSRLQNTSLLFGTLVGLLIQCSSLSANCFVINQPWYYNHINDDAPLSATVREYIVMTSLTSSFLSSSMGIALLLIVRALLIRVYRIFTNTDDLMSHNLNDTHTPTNLYSFITKRDFFLHVECYFAVGAVLGLNIAWTVTEYVLSLESHLLQSFYTLVGTMTWCHLVLFCCGYRYNNVYTPTQDNSTIAQ